MIITKILWYRLALMTCLIKKLSLFVRNWYLHIQYRIYDMNDGISNEFKSPRNARQ